MNMMSPQDFCFTNHTSCNPSLNKPNYCGSQVVAPAVLGKSQEESMLRRLLGKLGPSAARAPNETVDDEDIMVRHLSCPQCRR